LDITKVVQLGTKVNPGRRKPVSGDGQPEPAPRLSAKTRRRIHEFEYSKPRGGKPRAATFPADGFQYDGSHSGFLGIQAEIALDAWRRYGKGMHKAGLNFGDCAAYALAKTSNEPLLYKGSDFPETDIATIEADGSGGD